MKRWDDFALATRVVLAVVWFYNGLWLKILAVDPHHAQIVATTLGHPLWLTAIGVGETLLALGILSGRAGTVINAVQIALVVAMNLVAIGGGQIEKPAALIVSNLPLITCAAALMVFGPGRRVFPGSRR
jgi:uncharacterized membrane protein YphA (DoxX/SURF4 family)